MSKAPVCTWDGTEVAEASECHRKDGSHCGIDCDAEAIRAVLRHSQRFDAAEIASWPDSRHIIVPDGTGGYTWILGCAQNDEGFAYKVRVFYSGRLDRIFIHEHDGDFDPKELRAGEWFAWARNGELIEKEVVYTARASL